MAKDRLAVPQINHKFAGRSVQMQMAKEITHDNFIKQLLSHRELAVDFLREYLPGPLASLIDFETLTPLDTSYVSKDLKATFSDLVWSATIHGKKKLRISLLLEHKSFVDSRVAFQLLEYLASGYRKQIKEQKTVEPIIPILYYHGRKGWEFKAMDTFFSEYPEVVKPYLPAFATEFVDLQKIPHEQIFALTHNLLTSAILCQKYYFDPAGFEKHFRAIFENLAPYWERNVTYSIFVYIMQNPHLDQEFIKESIKNLPKDMSTKVMTAYDQLIAQGREQGIAEERERSMVKTVLNAYDNGFDLTSIRLIIAESEERINDILKQHKRIR